MRKLIIRLSIALVLLSAITSSGWSQDLLILRDGDSLNCAIKEINAKEVKICNIVNGRKVYNNIASSDVKLFKYGYFAPPEHTESDDYKKNPLNNIRISINGGWSYRPASVNKNIPDQLKSYMEELKSGFCYSADLRLFFNEHIGVGAKYFVHRSIHEDNIMGYGLLKDDIKINYMGPMFTARFMNRNNINALILDAGFGYVSFIDDGSAQNNKVELKGETFGISLNVGYDIGLSPNVGVGFQLTINTGMLTEYDVISNGTTETIELESENYENLTQINISAGLRFNL